MPSAVSCFASLFHENFDSTTGSITAKRPYSETSGRFFLALDPPQQFLQQHQRQEAAEDMAADRLVAAVIDRPGLEHRLTTAERLFDHPKVFVAQRAIGRPPARYAPWGCRAL